MNTVITRSRFYAVQAALFTSCVAATLLLSYLAARIVHSAWLTGAVNVLAFVLARIGLDRFVGGQISYRKYVASHGGELVAPSRFWATTGQVVVCCIAVAAVGVVSSVALSAPEHSMWRPAAMVMWPVVLGGTLIFLLIARDWRRELASSSNAA